MGYCDVDDVKAIVATDIDGSDIQFLIEETDAIIDLMVSGVSAIVLRAISRTWTAYKVMLKDPASQRIGPYSDSRIENIKSLRGEYKGMLSAAEGGISFVVGGITT